MTDLWFKQSVDFWSNEKTLAAIDMADGEVFVAVMFQMLLATNTEGRRDGILEAKDVGRRALRHRLSAVKGDASLDDVDRYLAVLAEARFIAPTDDGGFEIVGWDDDWRGPLTGTERSKKSRAKKGGSAAESDDVSVRTSKPGETPSPQRECNAMQRSATAATPRNACNASDQNKSRSDIDHDHEEPTLDRPAVDNSPQSQQDPPSDSLRACVPVLRSIGYGNSDRQRLRVAKAAGEDPERLRLLWLHCSHSSKVKSPISLFAHLMKPGSRERREAAIHDAIKADQAKDREPQAKRRRVEPKPTSRFMDEVMAKLSGGSQ